MSSLLSERIAAPLSPPASAEVERKLLQGVTYRTGIICKLYIFTFLIFAVYSLDYINIFAPDVTLWQNIWPRLLFNTLPFTLIYFVFRRKKISDQFKINLWIVALPLIMTAASCIYVWPLILQGHWELYLMINTTNVYALSFWFIYGGPTLRQSLSMLFSTLVFFWAPLFWVLSQTGNHSVMSVFLNDNLMSVGVNLFGAYTIYRLRRRLAVEDVTSKNEIRKFLGNRVSEAVFEGRTDLLAERSQNAFIVAMDLRGSTNMMRELSSDQATKFMESYHRAVNQIIAENGGYIHKTAGDGHLISFGLMDEDADLSDLPELENQLTAVDLKKNRYHFSKTVTAIEKTAEEVNRLNTMFGLKRHVLVGAAVDFGAMNIKIVGDESFRKELDIFGIPIIKAVRLENYSKFVMADLKISQSILLCSNEAIRFVATAQMPKDSFQIYRTGKNPVRDFPDMTEFHFHAFGEAAASIEATESIAATDSGNESTTESTTDARLRN